MDLTRYAPIMGSQDSVRFAYLRLKELQKAVDDDRILDAIVKQLEVPGKPAVLKALSKQEKLKAAENQIEHFRKTKTSVWFEAAPAEVLAATIFRSELPAKVIQDLFCNVKKESALLKPVGDWLKVNGMDAYAEIPTGTSRVDVLGYKKGGWLSSTAIAAIELKDDLEQLKRGLDQMTTYSEYAHRVYLACTPYLAAMYVDRHSEAVKVRHWDAGVLNRKLEQFGFGLLLIEGDSVYEYIKPQSKEPNKKKLEEIELSLKGRNPL